MATKKITSKKSVKKVVAKKANKIPVKTKSKPKANVKKVAKSKPSPKSIKKLVNKKPEKKKVVVSSKEKVQKVVKKAIDLPKKKQVATVSIKKKQDDVKIEKAVVKSPKIPAPQKEIKNTSPVQKNTKPRSKKKEKDELDDLLDMIQVPVQRKAKGKNKPKKDPTGLPVLKRNNSNDHEEEIIKNRPSHSPVSKYQRFELEFPFHTTTGLLYEFFSEPSGLQEWFCNDVNVKGDIYIFYWDGSYQQAVLLKKRQDYYARFRWLDEPEDTYFEFRLETDELTRDVSLIVTDFAENDESKETSTRLWNAQIEKLHQILGSY